VNILVTNTSGEGKTVLTKTSEYGSHSELSEATEGVFLDNPMLELAAFKRLPLMNSCVGVQNLMMSKELQQKFYEDFLGVSNLTAQSTIFAIFNGTEFSDWLEVSYSGRLMNEEVGPNIGFSTGVSSLVLDDVQLQGRPHQSRRQLCSRELGSSEERISRRDLGLNKKGEMGIAQLSLPFFSTYAGTCSTSSFLFNAFTYLSPAKRNFRRRPKSVRY